MKLTEAGIGQYLKVRLEWARLHEWQRGASWNQAPIPAYVMWLVQRGAIDVRLNGEQFRVSEGEIWLYPYVENRMLVVREDARWFTLGFDVTLYGNIDLLKPLAYTKWQVAEAPMLENWLALLVQIERTTSWEDALMRDSILRAVVSWCWQKKGGLEQLAQEFLSPWLRGVLESMREDLQKSIHEHVENSGYSPAQFRRHFHQAMNCSPHDYLIRLRMERARHLLETTALPIAEIADTVGFFSAEHFARLFRKKNKMSPSQFRQMARQLKV